MENRKSAGWAALGFLLIFTVLTWMSYKSDLGRQEALIALAEFNRKGPRFCGPFFCNRGVDAAQLAGNSGALPMSGYSIVVMH